jgi:hypothetical protein
VNKEILLVVVVVVVVVASTRGPQQKISSKVLIASTNQEVISDLQRCYARESRSASLSNVSRTAADEIHPALAAGGFLALF